MTVVRFEGARVEVAVSRPELARAIEEAVRSALAAFAPPPRYPTVRLRTRRRLEALGPAAIEGRVAIVRVTERGLARLPALVEDIRGQGALGVQLVWDGATPPRARAEVTIFRVLERARATKGGPPVYLAGAESPVLALRAAIAARTGDP